MGSVMKQWSGEIAAATDEAARRALLGRISVWRATKLGDMVAQRQAAGAISRLHALLGNSAGAEQEARSLISLCQTHPAAPKEDLREAQALLAGLGGEKAIVGPRPSDKRRERKPRDARERRERGSKPTRDDRTSRVGQAMSLARNGKWEQANQALAGGRGPSTQLARTWIRLAWALSAPDDAARVAGIREVESSLAEYLERGGRGRTEDKADAKAAKEPRAAKEPKAAKTPKAAPIEHPLDDVLGTLTPKRWRDRLRLLEEAVLASPERVDEIAAMALDHHVAVSGDRSPAPWLANLVSTALAAGGTAVKSAVESLTEKGAFAVSLYSESAFDELVALRTASEAAGYSVVSLRRGVLSRGEPADRRVWTFRAEKDGTELLYARAPESDVPWEKDLAVRIANRLPELCPRIALYAPGSGNDALRAASEKLGLHIVTDPSTDALVASFGTLAVSTAPPSPAEALKALVATGVPEDAALDEAVGAFGRAYQAFRASRPVLDERTDSGAASARLAFLKSVDRVAPEHVRIPEGTSWAVRLSAVGVDTGLLSDTSRFGGPGIDTVVAIATGLAAANLTVERVQVGASKRERREDAVLSTMDAPYGGLWRLMVGEVEVAVLTDLTPEGRVAATRLLTGDGPRVVVVPLDGDLLSWWRSTGGADPIGWTGEEGADVARAIQELTPAL